MSGIDDSSRNDGRLRAGLRGLAVASAAMAAAGLLGGCGGGGGSAPKPAGAANLYVKSFSVPNYAGIYLDEDLKLELSAEVNEDSINPDSFQMRTGAQGGTAPYGVFVRGQFLVDPATGNRVVVNPEGAQPTFFARIENGTRSLLQLPAGLRIDLGNDEEAVYNGLRQPLFDRTKRNLVTFIPEIPTRAALDDTGFLPGANYTVVVPGYPATNTLENLAGDQLLDPNNRIFTSSFRVVAANAPQLFRGAESAGIPRVIHSSPFNGTDQVAVTTPIAIQFSQPLDPRTVTTAQFKVELISVPAPYPQIPVSVFLAQQRLGKVEVTLTPINPMPADGTIRVTVSSGVEDLLGQAINTSVISFFTGVSVTPFIPDPLEDFNDVLGVDAANTTANWDNSKPFVGGVLGQLTATFAPYAGDGTDGAFSATVGQTTVINTGSLAQRVYNYSSFTIPIGARVDAQGSYPLVIHCQGNVDISGELHLDASPGANGFRGDVINGPATGGFGGAGGPGGNKGGDGAMATIGAGGNFDGNDGTGLTAGSGGLGGNTGENDGNQSLTSNSPAGASGPFWPRLQYAGGPSQCAGPTPCTSPVPKSFDPMRQREGGGGGGGSVVGGNSDNSGATLIRRGGASFNNGGKGGQIWGTAAMTGASVSASVKVVDPANPPNLRTISLTGIPTFVAGMGGAGGGGGGGEDDSQGDLVHWGAADGSDEGGGGGGGGGGAVQITAYGTLNVGGTISCKGGKGGSSYDDVTLTQFSQGAGGGGGSGGAIWLQSHATMTVQGGAVLDVTGGIGGQGNADGTTTVFNGGTGALGRVRLEDADGAISGAPAAASLGVFTPTLDLDSTAYSIWHDEGIFTPNFSAPVVDADVFPGLPFNGTIKIYMEGTQPDVNAPVSSPDLSPTKLTGWIKVWDSTIPGGLVAGNPWDLLDNNEFWRFRVDFHVDPFHTFTDPLPTVRQIQFKISQ